MWWLFERFYDNPDFDGAYTATGAFGQFITVIPKRDIVVVHKTTVDIYT
jgi:CubicO group peptidase (beta-lactamase class C family)